MEPGFRSVKVSGRSSFGSPAACAVIGCGELIQPGSIYCACHRSARRKRASLVDAGPAPDHELDVVTHGLRARLAGKKVSIETHPCAYPDCGQPALRGRLYCSTRCRTRARTEPALITIEGVVMSLRDHASARGLDIATVYCRMRAGDSAEEAITRPIDDEMQRRRHCA